MVFLLILGIITLLLINSKIRIEIQNLEYSTETKQHINNNYKIKIKFNILNKITIAKSTITNQKLKKSKIKEKVKQIDFKARQKENKIDKNIIKAIKHINIQFKKINLQMEIGTENACVTSFIIPAVSTVIAIYLRKKIKENQDQTFIIMPIYQDKNVANIYLSGIFEIKMIHIINIIYILNKKGRVRKHEPTSHRRTYDYSYE